MYDCPLGLVASFCIHDFCRIVWTSRTLFTTRKQCIIPQSRVGVIIYIIVKIVNQERVCSKNKIRSKT